MLDGFPIRFLIMLELTLSLALLLAPAGPVAADVPTMAPIEDEAYVLDLVAGGFRNGRMPPWRMILTSGCLMERDAGYALALMIEAASEDGVRLAPEWCYRSLAQQRATYDRNCPLEEIQHTLTNPVTGEVLTGDDGVPLTESETKRVCAVTTASPGRSNHGWGRAVDFSTGRRSMGCRDRAFFWLLENASRFGWTHPDWAQCGRQTAEPWHWEWGGLQAALPLATVIPERVPIPPGVE